MTCSAIAYSKAGITSDYAASGQATRTNRDTKEIAIEAANVLKAANPYAKVVIRDRETGET